MKSIKRSKSRKVNIDFQRNIKRSFTSVSLLSRRRQSQGTFFFYLLLNASDLDAFRVNSRDWGALKIDDFLTHFSVILASINQKPFLYQVSFHCSHMPWDYITRRELLIAFVSCKNEHEKRLMVYESISVVHDVKWERVSRSEISCFWFSLCSKPKQTHVEHILNTSLDKHNGAVEEFVINERKVA